MSFLMMLKLIKPNKERTMRHKNSYSYSPCHEKQTICKPYLAHEWTFANPNVKNKYIQVLQYAYDHPGCTRRELHEHVFKTPYVPGNRSSMYAVLLWKDFIDYDHKFRYFITPSGLELLKKAYINGLKNFARLTTNAQQHSKASVNFLYG